MGGEQAASVLATVHRDAGQLDARARPRPSRPPIRQKYEDEGNPYYATARLWDDGVIDPAQTRDVLGLALAACLNAPIPEAPALRRVPDVRGCLVMRIPPHRQPRRDRLPHHPHRAPPGHPHGRGLFRRRRQGAARAPRPTRRCTSARRRRARAICVGEQIIAAAKRDRRGGDPSRLRLPVRERRLRPGRDRRRPGLGRPAARDASARWG